MKRAFAIALAWLAWAGMAFGAVNVNTATKEDLEALKEIGPEKAQAIVDYRREHGPFQSLDDLDRVKGIGKATLLAIKKDITFSGPNTGIAPMKRDNRAEDRSDARAQRGDSMAAPERVARREEVHGAVDINTASERELEQLPGVGPARAKAIVHGRPYRSKDELVARQILPESAYEGVKDRIVAHHSDRKGG